MKRKSAAIHCAVASAVALTCAAVAKADVVVNSFDSASEVPQWRFDYGNPDSHTESFSTDDAEGSPTSGSLDIQFNINTTTQAEYSAYTRDAFFPGFDATPFVSLDMDVKVVPGSAVDQYGIAGYFQLWIRNTDNYTNVQQFGDNVTPGAWRHISVPLGTQNPSDINAVRAFTFQLYSNGTGGGYTGVNGPVDLRIDNLKLVASCASGRVAWRAALFV